MFANVARFASSRAGTKALLVSSGVLVAAPVVHEVETQRRVTCEQKQQPRSKDLSNLQRQVCLM